MFNWIKQSLLKTVTKINKMQQNNCELWVISFCKTISKEVHITCIFIFLSHPLLHPNNPVHLKFCFLQRQHFMQVVPQLHLMSSLQAWDASAIVVQIGSIPSSFSLRPHSSMLISSDHFLFALHHYNSCSHCCKTWELYRKNIQSCPTKRGNY